MDFIGPHADKVIAADLICTFGKRFDFVGFLARRGSRGSECAADSDQLRIEIKVLEIEMCVVAIGELKHRTSRRPAKMIKNEKAADPSL